MIFSLLPRHRREPTFSPSFHIVPAASVWEPSPTAATCTRSPRVRTLRAAPLLAPGGPPPPHSRSGGTGRASARREAGRTYLLGALLGFSVVVGTVYAVNGETAALPPQPAGPVSAVVAK